MKTNSSKKDKAMTVLVDYETHRAYKRLCLDKDVTIDSRLKELIANDLKKNNATPAEARA